MKKPMKAGAAACRGLILCGALMLTAALPSLAQDMPVPKIFRGMEKGQWRTEMLESAATKSGRAVPGMTICTDNLMKHSSDPAQKSQTSCKRRLLKDSSDEAVMESVCPERTTTVSFKRESAKSMLMNMKSTGQSGPREMKIRYTYLGACRPGQGTMSYDKNTKK